MAAYDPKAAEEAERLYLEALADGRLVLATTKEEAAEGADALVICTEWKRFMAPNFDQLATTLRQKLIFDGRNLYDPELSTGRGLQHGLDAPQQDPAGHERAG